jgi:hypothetical protein
LGLPGKPRSEALRSLSGTGEGNEAGQPLSPRQSVALAAVCGASGIAAWTLWVWVLKAEPAQDWMVFYTAARAYSDGNLPLIFDGDALTAALNERFVAWLATPLNLHPWVYPPTFLLLFVPFGMLAPAVSLAVFLVTGFILLLAVAFLYVGRGQPRLIILFSLVLCPGRTRSSRARSSLAGSGSSAAHQSSPARSSGC